MMLISEYLQQPFDPKNRNIDRILEEAIEEQKKKQEHKNMVKEIKRIWNK